ncbi:hypothetical protein LTR84_006773 [Exophiala bonariae]|uniref:Peptidase A1 domain-containing protein n=1 Tax=Exophiala bonariae TaxID=1690606 RepID=A0AAV9N111_9EURO|nr:hypothetical protein LTR84_006773 [Exophiala bonariae]
MKEGVEHETSDGINCDIEALGSNVDPKGAALIELIARRNNSCFYDESPRCESGGIEQCIAARGGAFDESSSSTLSANSIGFRDFSRLDPQLALNDDEVLVNTDTLTINTSFAVEHYPFGIPRQDLGDYSSLGLGRDSSLLTMLRDAGSIASRSYSLYWGQTGTATEHQLDGNLVLGGVDVAKISGQNYTTGLGDATLCPSGLVVSVSDMTMNFPNGTSASIMGGVSGQTVNYCIRPDFPLITVTPALWEQWMIAHPPSFTDGGAQDRARGLPNLWGLIYPPSLIFQGDLKLTIDQTMEIIIPNHQLVQHYYTFDDKGDISVNDSVLELMINPLQDVNENDFPQLGMTFLQAAYLHVNYDDDILMLWQAKATESQSPIGIGKSGTGCAAFPTDTSSATSVPQPQSNSLTPGAISGIVVGVVVAMKFIAGMIFWGIARRRHSSELNATRKASDHSGGDGHTKCSSIYRKPELEASEVIVDGGQRHTIQPWSSGQIVVELPSERYD